MRFVEETHRVGDRRSRLAGATGEPADVTRGRERPSSGPRGTSEDGKKSRASVAALSVAGIAAAGLALGVGELMAAILRSPSPVVTVAEWTIDRAPTAIVRRGIEIFGTADKPVLVVGIVATALIIGAAMGVLASRRPWFSVVGLAIFGVIGAAASSRRPGSSASRAAVVASFAVVAGTVSLIRLVGAAPLRRVAGPSPDQPAAYRHKGRREFLQSVAVVAGVAALSADVGRWLADRFDVAAARAAVVLPRLAGDTVLPPPDTSFPIPDLTSLVTPSGEFYRIDTAVVAPQIHPQGWRLRVRGMVGRPYTLSLADLLALPMVEEYVTLSCVSNEVGGPLIGTARWLGVPLSYLLDRADVQPTATQLVGRSVDGFTVGFPTSQALDGRVAMVAVGMNGAPLPLEHGFPARLVVAGLYGYVSATKWLQELELTTLEGFDAYWVPRGWDKEAPIKTESRIDVPRDGQVVRAGTVPVAGVAWAPTRGIARVEVQVDEGAWQEARLAASLSDNTWRQWWWPWAASNGGHTVRVRATDGHGEVQDAAQRPPPPNGATGLHSVTVRVN